METTPDGGVLVGLTPVAWPEAGGLRELLEKNDLELSGIDAGTLRFDSAAEALEAAARIGRCALLARQLDGPRVIFRAAEGRIEHLVGAVEKLTAAMRGYTFELCAANAADSLLATPGAFEEVASRVTTEPFGLALDPGAAGAAGWEPVEFARAARAPLRYVYFTDTLNGRPVLPGSGDVDWEPLIDGLRADGYAGYLSLLLPGADLLSAESDAKEARGYAEALIYRAE